MGNRHAAHQPGGCHEGVCTSHGLEGCLKVDVWLGGVDRRIRIKKLCMQYIYLKGWLELC